ncbi:MAG: hydantoinase/oxoprolinase family protein [Actinomycetota bacterium]
MAIDIGGTFTDLVVLDPEAGALTLAKADTTPARLDDGVMKAFDESGVDPASVELLIHGTTVVINAITERRGVPTALVTTRGFRDVLLIGRANRPDLYNLAYRKPEPFVPRRRCFEVTGRMSHRGDVLTPLESSELAGLAERIRHAEVEAVAICLLHSWANPAHERAVAEVLAALLPSVEIVASHQISSQWREFERTSTAVLAAYVKPVVAGYLSSLSDRVRGAGVPGRLYVMRSAGGVSSFERAVAAPINLLESGPVAGVAAAAEAGRRIGAQHVLALDIGGTTAKTSAVRDGRMRIETLHHVERTPVSAGYPVQAPVVEIVEIGAGGGSIAWADDAGGLHVGPRSAGAEPGPVCYGRGGSEPTLTDANLVAGRLDPAYFLGGTMPLDGEAARGALTRLGSAIGEANPAGVARGILRYAVAQMAHALRLVTLRRGFDPRDFTFVAYGGAGPLHAALLARELGISRTVIPPAPGHFSAFGMLLGGLRADAVRTHLGALDAAALGSLFGELEQEATAALEDPSADSEVERFLELRYAGQEHTLEIPLPAGPIDDAGLERLRGDFDRRSQEAYAFSLPSEVEVVAARVGVTAPFGRVEWPQAPTRAAHAFAPRQVDFDQHGGVCTAQVVDRGTLEVGEALVGPCIVEEPASTTLVLPGQRVRKDDLGNLLIDERDA